MKDITILLTACNGLITPSQIDCMRDVTERKITIIGVDMSDVGPGTHMVDKFIKIPGASAGGYADILYLICKENNVDLIIPKSDEEAIELSKHKSKFDIIHTSIMTNEYDIIC